MFKFYVGDLILHWNESVHKKNNKNQKLVFKISNESIFWSLILKMKSHYVLNTYLLCTIKFLIELNEISNRKNSDYYPCPFTHLVVLDFIWLYDEGLEATQQSKLYLDFYLLRLYIFVEYVLLWREVKY